MCFVWLCDRSSGRLLYRNGHDDWPPAAYALPEQIETGARFGRCRIKAQGVLEPGARFGGVVVMQQTPGLVEVCGAESASDGIVLGSGRELAFEEVTGPRPVSLAPRGLYLRIESRTGGGFGVDRHLLCARIPGFERAGHRWEARQQRPRVGKQQPEKQHGRGSQEESGGQKARPTRRHDTIGTCVHGSISISRDPVEVETLSWGPVLSINSRGAVRA